MLSLISRRPFGDLSLPLFDAGLVTTPLLHNGKAAFVPGWSDTAIRIVPRSEIAELTRKHPQSNVGLPLGPNCPVIAIDVDDEDRAEAVKLWHTLRAVVGPTPWIRVGRSPRFMAFYRKDNDRRPDRGVRSLKPSDLPIEIFGDSGQVAIAGNVLRGTRTKPYNWPRENPLSVHFSDLPEASAPQIADFLAAVRAQRQLAGTLTRHTRTDGTHERSTLSAERAGKNGAEYLTTIRAQINKIRAPDSLSGASGNRTLYINSIICSLVHRGYDNAEIFELFSPKLADFAGCSKWGNRRDHDGLTRFEKTITNARTKFGGARR